MAYSKLLIFFCSRRDRFKSIKKSFHLYFAFSCQLFDDWPLTNLLWYETCLLANSEYIRLLSFYSINFFGRQKHTYFKKFTMLACNKRMKHCCKKIDSVVIIKSFHIFSFARAQELIVCYKESWQLTIELRIYQS